MSIQTELTRITNAKEAIKTAIEGKGVTVPDGTMLDGMAALINSIQSGGGGVDIRFINAVNNSGYNGKMILGGPVGTIECDFTSKGEYNFNIPNPVPIKEFFNEFSVVFVTPISFPIRIMLDIIDKAIGQSGLLVRLVRA